MSLQPPSPASHPNTNAQYERKVRLVKRVVLSLACVVGLTLVLAVVLGVYHHVTDRPAKALFGFS
jgi:hypothetical protein